MHTAECRNGPYALNDRTPRVPIDASRSLDLRTKVIVSSPSYELVNIKHRTGVTRGGNIFAVIPGLADHMIRPGIKPARVFGLPGIINPFDRLTLEALGTNQMPQSQTNVGMRDDRRCSVVFEPNPQTRGDFLFDTDAIPCTAEEELKLVALLAVTNNKEHVKGTCI